MHPVVGQVNEVVTEDFGNVIVVAVGATIVGSIRHTAPVGSTVAKGDELGYFAFGGSTVLTLFLVRVRVRVRVADAG
jgi:phosphatidylserine decarboxylase